MSPKDSPAAVGQLASAAPSLALSARNGLYLDLPQLGAAEGRGFQLQQCLRGLGARAGDPVAVPKHPKPPSSVKSFDHVGTPSVSPLSSRMEGRAWAFGPSLSLWPPSVHSIAIAKLQAHLDIEGLAAALEALLRGPLAGPRLELCLQTCLIRAVGRGRPLPVSCPLRSHILEH